MTTTDAFRPHPWHGVATGPEPPEIVTAYIEITPRDVVKYELDKESGLLRVDRLMQTSSSPPTLYGLIPRTFCGPRVAALSATANIADGDPLDICIFSERPIDRADILVTARVIGGLRMIDGGEADDKVIAVLDNDPTFGDLAELHDLPSNIVDRLDHYFRTYKGTPDSETVVEIETRYGAAEAHTVVEAAMADYADVFGT